MDTQTCPIETQEKATKADEQPDTGSDSDQAKTGVAGREAKVGLQVARLGSWPIDVSVSLKSKETPQKGLRRGCWDQTQLDYNLNCYCLGQEEEV